MAHLEAYPTPNKRVCMVLVAAVTADTRGDPATGACISASDAAERWLDSKLNFCSRLELDYHANMMVFGTNCYVISRSGRCADVNAWSQNVGKMDAVSIVDAAVIYEHPYTHKKYLLIARNALYVPSMKHHLVPPFILREAGLIVNDTPKCQVQGLVTEEHHSIYSRENDLKIPLSLKGTFSYFNTRAPTLDDLEDPDSIEPVLISPKGPDWNPNTDVYARNEACYLDWRGNIIEEKDREVVLIDDEDSPNGG